MLPRPFPPPVAVQFALTLMAFPTVGALIAYMGLMNALGWLGLSTVSFRAGDMREAERAARELLRLQPGNLDALRVLSEIAQRAGGADSTTRPGAATGGTPP